jgi:diguanylate cyclase (GGDEF)-like protein
MTLRKQLWIAVAIIMLLALITSIVVSTLSARHYLSQQLQVKNIDNATSLALALTQLPKDETTLSLQIAAQFDTGHYRRIRLEDPQGKAIIERENTEAPQGVPNWFVNLARLEPRPGFAHISDGWSRFGVLQVESQTSYAYETLWQGTMRLASIFLIGLVLIGLLGTYLLSRTVRPLGQVVDQAEAIGQQRFITLPEPRTREFRLVVQAMNRLSGHVRQMLRQESIRLEKLRQRLQHDQVTGLPTREYFMARLQSMLQREHGEGILIVLRINDLEGLNQQLGRQQLDGLLNSLARTLEASAGSLSAPVSGRLNGTDLALIVSPHDTRSAKSAARKVFDALIAQPDDHPTQIISFAIGATGWEVGEEPGQVLARADAAVAQATMANRTQAGYAYHGRESGPYMGQENWREAISSAIEKGGVRLGSFPVTAPQGTLLHHEAPMRLEMDGQAHSAAVFMPWAIRLDLIRRLDEAVLQAAYHQLRDPHSQDLAINLSVASLRDTGLRQRLEATLQKEPQLAQRLWLEFPAAGALEHPAELWDMCRIGRRTGCRIGLEHADSQVLGADNLGELGLAYIKLDRSLTQQVNASPETRRLISGLCGVAHAIGILVIAEGCDETGEREWLSELGLDGMTGKAIRTRN